MSRIHTEDTSRESRQLFARSKETLLEILTGSAVGIPPAEAAEVADAGRIEIET
jgi:hypothetical protein